MPTGKFNEGNCVFRALENIYENAGHNMEPRSSMRTILIQVCQRNVGPNGGVSAGNVTVELSEQGLTVGPVYVREYKPEKRKCKKTIALQLRQDLAKGAHLMITLVHPKGPVGHAEPLFPSGGLLPRDKRETIRMAAMSLRKYGGEALSFRPIQPEKGEKKKR
ncbi:hypothetical protein KKC08_01065 [Patescibacteria group bacterium]|nr:hypothetical protein [Patescibacteria group bacterium]MCG2701563.1 hypothetical protein [Candidatus Parcubacteria bacterium]MBU4264469.1 hypothetical protein [Patescibacteria group bacterium]MBU4390400.1 hypothetical protein [Patescibacteria group bacterium]MBU4396744.1 hypothetical protein [Patescibacteria group bacterium]